MQPVILYELVIAVENVEGQLHTAGVYNGKHPVYKYIHNIFFVLKILIRN